MPVLEQGEGSRAEAEDHDLSRPHYRGLQNGNQKRQ